MNTALSRAPEGCRRASVPGAGWRLLLARSIVMWTRSIWTRSMLRSLLILLLASSLPAGTALLCSASAAAAADPVTVKATSPGYTRVGVVPDAVSVTFTGSIKDDGASVTVTGPGGQQFGLRREVVDDTLREFLAPGPAGPYDAEWAATGKGGEKLSGSFSFVAARAHAGYVVPSSSPSPTPSSSPAPSPSVSASAPGRDRYDIPRIVIPAGLAAVLVVVSVLIAVADRRRRTRSV